MNECRAEMTIQTITLKKFLAVAEGAQRLSVGLNTVVFVVMVKYGRKISLVAQKFKWAVGFSV